MRFGNCCPLPNSLCPWILKLFSFSADIWIRHTYNQVWQCQLYFESGITTMWRFCSNRAPLFCLGSCLKSIRMFPELWPLKIKSNSNFNTFGHLTMSFLTITTWMKRKKKLLGWGERQRQQVKIRVDDGYIVAVKITTRCYEEDEINVHNRAHSSMCIRTSLHFPSSPRSFHRLSPHLWGLTFLHLTMQLECPNHLKHPDTFQM